MISTASLAGSHLRTYQTIFQNPIAHDLGWSEVRALLRQLAHIAEEPNGSLKATRHGETLVLHPARTKAVSDPAEIMALRHFIERSEPPASTAKTAAANWLVVIDHREARIYRSTEPGSVPQQIRPHAPEDIFRPAPHSKEFARDQEKPDPNNFFEPGAGVLHGAGKILIFGTGPGSSSERDQFVAWLKQHRPKLAERMVGAVVIAEHHLPEPQLLAQAREFYTSVRPS